MNQIAIEIASHVIQRHRQVLADFAKKVEIEGPTSAIKWRAEDVMTSESFLRFIHAGATKDGTPWVISYLQTGGKDQHSEEKRIEVIGQELENATRSVMEWKPTRSTCPISCFLGECELAAYQAAVNFFGEIHKALTKKAK